MELGGRQDTDATVSFIFVKIGEIEGEDDILRQRFGMMRKGLRQLLSERLMLWRLLFKLNWSILRILLLLINLILILWLQQMNGIHEIGVDGVSFGDFFL